MLSLTVTVLALHAVCLAGLAVVASRDSMLVDEQGRRLSPDGAWREQRVPAPQALDEVPLGR